MGLQEARYGAMGLEKLISNRRGRKPQGPQARRPAGCTDKQRFGGLPGVQPLQDRNGVSDSSRPVLHSALFPFSCNQKEYSAPTMIRRPGMG